MTVAGDRSGRPVLVLTHVPWEGPGLIGDALAAEGLDLLSRSVVDLSDPELPSPTEIAALVVMGGPMGALDDGAHPGLAAERALLAACVDADVPVLGVCLGMQLLAAALGATVHPAHGTEIGFAPVNVLAADPVLGPLGPRPTVLHWHGDAVDLPAGATVLARTSATPVQAFRAGSALGLQFHLEVDRPLLQAWLTSPMARDVAGREAALRADAETALPALAPAARAGLAAFAATAVARR